MSKLHNLRAPQPLLDVRLVLLEVLRYAPEGRLDGDVLVKAPRALLPLVVLHCLQRGERLGVRPFVFLRDGLLRGPASADARYPGVPEIGDPVWRVRSLPLATGIHAVQRVTVRPGRMPHKLAHVPRWIPALLIPVLV